MSEELNSSKLGTLEYWERAYEQELENFNQFGDEGEIWFGAQTAKRVINWLTNKQLDRGNTRCIDIGCGNGFSCCMMAEAGFRQIVGVDYSEKAINLAKSIAESKKLSIEYKVTDVLDSNAKYDDQFDVAIDKGTYDAISLCPDDPKNKRFLYKDYLKKILNQNAFFVITSCNWTSKELQEFFSENKDFKFVEEIKASSSFSFGGSTGSTTSTLVFEFNSK
ncbi:hypothetical protein BpHYR1_000249 [Brachionus plicatilis]|uniref:Protein-lysine N-methyltransferase BpHYR1_000249 n=1 Tax=Brachionus plicatilis TaxID=10195 RepID=A0A3M7R726_BRAPC|nr:hypothetical protein BpHYR1_000249 [Brachionus plicatilis]